jgi:quinol monooxygenase YgiN
LAELNEPVELLLHSSIPLQSYSPSPLQKKGKAQELINALHVLMKPTHSEAGCIRYELNQRSDDPSGITFIEKWRNRKASTNIAVHRPLFNVVRPELVDRFEVKLFEEILP